MGYVIQSIENDVLRWTIDRADRGNGIGPTIANELLSLARALTGRAETQCPVALILSAKPVGNPKQPTWIAGGDLNELSSLDSSGAQAYAKTMAEFCSTIEELPFTVIGLVDGRTIGGGVEVALATDIRVATERSTFEFAQMAMGLATGYGSASKMISLFGLAKTQNWLLSQAIIAGHSLAEEGLVHSVYPNMAAMEQATQTIVSRLREAGRTSVRIQKEMLRRASGNPTHQRRYDEVQLFGELWRNPTHESRLEAWKHRSPKS